MGDFGQSWSIAVKNCGVGWSIVDEPSWYGVMVMGMVWYGQVLFGMACGLLCGMVWYGMVCGLVRYNLAWYGVFTCVDHPGKWERGTEAADP